ncbi:MAG: SOS response-associated peptidase [Armatimonadetes bacterium]|nr:SOS response-associated peptidase [Armatimonadota bacterium]
MCARYSLIANEQQLKSLFDIVDAFEFEPRVNIAPKQVMPILLANHHLVPAEWGLTAKWDPKRLLINARSETLATTRTFAPLAKSKRCVIPATGFFEWKTEGSQKLPRLFQRKGAQPFAFAGVYDEDDKGQVHFVILTTGPNQTVAEVHDRMPCMLLPGEVDHWLKDAEVPGPFDEAEMVGFSVTPKVNHWSYQGEDALLQLS